MRIRGDIATVTLKPSRVGKQAPPHLYLVRDRKGRRVGINRPLTRWSDRDTCLVILHQAVQRRHRGGHKRPRRWA